MDRRHNIRNYSYISSGMKYMIFVLNLLFWLMGGLLIGIGLYAFHDKFRMSEVVLRVNTVYDVLLDVSLALIFFGGVVFVVSFAGCIGALRENTCLLKFYCYCLLVFFFLEMSLVVLGYCYPQLMKSMIEESFTESIIHKYRDNDDLRNFIDFAQKEFHCCGLSSDGYMDWAMNEYFNCSSPSSEKCGVPYSCCINATNISGGLINVMCGYDVQKLSVAEASKKVWTSGCIEIVRSYAEKNLFTVACVALGVALSQLLVIYLGKTLESQIILQKARWSS